MLSLERKRSYCIGQDTILCVILPRYNNEVQYRISEPYKHHYLRDSIAKKIRKQNTFVRILLFIYVFSMHLDGIYR